VAVVGELKVLSSFFLLSPTTHQSIPNFCVFSKRSQQEMDGIGNVVLMKRL
jgi:hypothetical protein